MNRRLATMAGRKARLVPDDLPRRRREERSCGLFADCSARGPVDCRGCVQYQAQTTVTEEK